MTIPSRPIKLGMVIDYAGVFDETVELIVAYEQARLGMLAIPEAYSFDAVSQLGYIASRTERLELMSSILPIYSRAPSRPAGGQRLPRSEVRRSPWAHEGGNRRLSAGMGQEARRIRGDHYVMPLTSADGGSGLGKSLRLINRPIRADIPISVDALGLKSVAMVAELARGWQQLFFDPRKAADVWGDALAEGLAERDPELGPLEIQLQ
ncbi:LLM class flavin-dependent oxidoreductase [Nocardioides sp. LHD-245]|uniref:LLM class flavin-dependent oxidoreductase n=1 Tax=Nocardioides sp. LHD-245 TaxID=3051387 RepID=UPI0027DF4A3E|nr:LLM class flavin-dependent oxidoreductase [Nocardioides sp. LHD-245]